MPAMKIDALEVHLIATPMRSKRSHGLGDVAHAVKRVIIEVKCDGLVGLGEAAPWEVFSGTAEANASAIDRAALARARIT